MRKILVIGCCGSGKSTFSRRLNEIIKIDVIHLDREYWNPGWVEPPKDEWKKLVETLITRDAWIMDGNYSGTLELRLHACDTMIYLDMKPWVCLWRVAKRFMIFRKRRRPDMAEGCNEKIDLTFFLWVWSYKTRSRPKTVKLIQDNLSNKKIVWLKSDAEVGRFLEEERMSFLV